MDTNRLRAILDRLPERMRTPERVAVDPVSFPRSFEDPADREVAGLVAAAFAYGRVEAFRPKIASILAALGPHPARRAVEIGRRAAHRAFEGFAYRFHRGPDVAGLVLGVGKAIRDHGSLGGALAAASDGGRLPLRDGLAGFVRALREAEGEPARPNRFHLLPDPATGSACKRLNLFMRWMVRPEDGIDMGLWTFYRPADLVVPLDVHVARAGRILGLTTRRSADWTMAREITAGLARVDPDDPLRFDFHLSHLGMLGQELVVDDLRQAKCGAP